MGIRVTQLITHNPFSLRCSRGQPAQVTAEEQCYRASSEPSPTTHCVLIVCIVRISIMRKTRPHLSSSTRSPALLPSPWPMWTLIACDYQFLSIRFLSKNTNIAVSAPLLRLFQSSPLCSLSITLPVPGTRPRCARLPVPLPCLNPVLCHLLSRSRPLYYFSDNLLFLQNYLKTLLSLDAAKVLNPGSRNRQEKELITASILAQTNKIQHSPITDSDLRMHLNR